MINWNRIRDLKADMGEDGFAEVADLFVEEVEGELATLDPAAAPELFARQLHALKGSALNLGFSVLAERCAEGELCAAAGQGARVSVAEIRAIYRASKSAFEAGEAAAPMRRAG